MADDASQALRSRVDAIFKAMTPAQWGRVRVDLLNFALARGQSKARANDLAQEALLRVLDARWEPWDPDAQPDLTRFLMSIINRQITNENQKTRLHREIA